MMVRSRGGGCSVHGNYGDSGSKRSQCCEVNAPVEAKLSACTTKCKEMSCHLATQGIHILNFAYDFLIVEGLSRLTDTTDGNFQLSLRVLESSFIFHSTPSSAIF
ncbi:hypothetical protein J1N35_034216 [Gossypium stocksii]|uniref:Uncharacterized protein n=1 Tax=Gossypium stocksii TaxID=47602 RepID=A0A9D3ZP13_9ROSI|nr:hypothetical protein J1N35_034216 [Gossypium stocksii]